MALTKWSDLQKDLGIGILNAICEELEIPMGKDFDDTKEPEKGFVAKIRAVFKEMGRLKTTSVKRAIASLESKKELKEDERNYKEITNDVGELIEQRNQRELDEMEQLAIIKGESKAAGLEVLEQMSALRAYSTGEYQDPQMATAVQKAKELFYGGVMGSLQGYRNTNFLKNLAPKSMSGSATNPKQIQSSSTNP